MSRLDRGCVYCVPPRNVPQLALIGSTSEIRDVATGLVTVHRNPRSETSVESSRKVTFASILARTHWPEFTHDFPFFDTALSCWFPNGVGSGDHYLATNDLCVQTDWNAYFVPANHHDPSTWGTYDDCREFYTY